MNEINLNNQNIINEKYLTIQSLNNNIDKNNEYLDSLKEIKSINKFEDIQKKQDINKIEDIKNDSVFEYVITNNMFSFNREAEEFVVKVERNGKINQYPSEDMLKMKQFLMNQNF